MIVIPAMYEAFKKSMAEASDTETQADVFKNAIEAAIEAQPAWFRFLEGRAAALQECLKEGDTVEQAMRKLNFHDLAHAERVAISTRKED